MRGKSSPKSKNGVVEVDNLENLKQPHLSGAYIRTLVKELTSSRTKDSLNNKVVENSEGEGVSSNQNLLELVMDSLIINKKNLHNSIKNNNFPIKNLGHLSYSQVLCSPYSWPVSAIASPLLLQENLNFVLPSQTLGLNLNLQDFNLLETPCNGISKSSSVYSSSSASTSSSPATEEIPSMAVPPSVVAAEVT
ncbi:uncharacterized protein [Primulina eburnea]|uniref:uncharacterized protein n=1 Tax=Primulina eburnea TaxID=1245227 RepID=UPI003C6C5423